MKDNVNLNSERESANQLTLREVDCPGLFRWAQRNHKVLKSRQGDRRESERDTAREKNGQRDENLLALKIGEGAIGLQKVEKEENRFVLTPLERNTALKTP